MFISNNFSDTLSFTGWRQNARKSFKFSKIIFPENHALERDYYMIFYINKFTSMPKRNAFFGILIFFEVVIANISDATEKAYFSVCSTLQRFTFEFNLK